MRAIIVDNTHIYFENITEWEEEALFEGLSACDDHLKFVDPAQRRHVWDGIHRVYNKVKKRLPLPMLYALSDLCEKNGMPLSIDDRRAAPAHLPIPAESITLDMLPGITLHDYQADWGRLVTERDFGNCCVPTGGGKGEMLALTCKVIPCPTIVLTEQQVVIVQLKSRLEMRCVAEEIGMFFAGKRPNGQPIVVGSINSLRNPKKPVEPTRTLDLTKAQWEKDWNKYQIQLKAFRTRTKNAKFLQEYVKKAAMLLVDESDLAVSDVWDNVFRYWFKGRYRYGFSGTPFDIDKPIANLKLEAALGPTIFEVPRSLLEDLGQVVPAEFVMLGVGEEGHKQDSSTYDKAFNKWIVHNQDLHRLTAKLCKKHLPDGGTLILVDKELLGNALVETLAAEGIEARFIYGKTPTKKREEALRAFEARTVKVLIGGKIINRGLDLKGGCENLIILTGGKLTSHLLQKVGRALRRNARGRARVYDFYFLCNKYLYGHSRTRLKAMVAAGYKCTVVLKRGTADGAKLVASRFMFSKKILAEGARPGIEAKAEQQELFA